MKLTILPPDGTVVVNSVPKIKLDLASAQIPSNIHALQWENTGGWIEYVGDSLNRPPNEYISSLPQWANACVEIYIEPLPADEPSEG